MQISKVSRVRNESHGLIVLTLTAIAPYTRTSDTLRYALCLTAVTTIVFGGQTLVVISPCDS